MVPRIINERENNLLSAHTPECHTHHPPSCTRTQRRKGGRGTGAHTFALLSLLLVLSFYSHIIIIIYHIYKRSKYVYLHTAGSCLDYYYCCTFFWFEEIRINPMACGVLHSSTTYK